MMVYAAQRDKKGWTLRGVMLAIMVVIVLGGLIWSGAWVIRGTKRIAPSPVVRIVKHQGLCFAVTEYHQGVAMVEVDCKKLGD